MDSGLLEAVKRFQAGDQGAFEEIYSKHYNRVKSGLQYMLKDEGLAEDLTQETFIKVYKNIGQLEDPEKFVGWTNTIATRTAETHLRKLSSTEVVFTDLDPSPEEDGPSFEEQLESEKDYEQPEKALDQKESQRMVREIIDGLSDSQRVAITMFYYNDMKIREIAAATGNSENAVKQSLFQAKKKIETKVRALEKQGIKLYSLSPFAFFLWLFAAQGGASVGTAAAVTGAAAVATAAAAGTAAASASAGAATATGTATAGAAAAGAAAGAAAKGGLIGWLAGLPAAAKITAAAVLGTAVIGGGTAAGVGLANRNRQVEPPVTTAVEISVPETEELTEPETVSEPEESEEEIETVEETTEESTEEETEEETESEEESTEEVTEAPTETVPVVPVTTAPTEVPTTAAPTEAPTEPETTEPESTEEALPDYVYKNEYFTFTLPESWRGKVEVEEISYDGHSGFQVNYQGYAIANMTYPGTDRNTEGGGVQAWKWVDTSRYLFVDFCGQSYGFFLEYWREGAYGMLMYNGSAVQVTEEFLRSDTCREIIYLQTGEWVDIDEWLGKHSAEDDYNYELRDKTQAYYDMLAQTCISVP